MYSKETLISLLKEWKEKNGREPSKREINADPDMPSDMAYRKHFGSWGNAVVECGFELKKPMISKQCEKAKSEKKRTMRGEKSPVWKGGKYKSYGYVMLWNQTIQKYEREHRVIMENHIGRKLRKDEDVHHINGIKDDNRLENLKLMTRAEHTKFHMRTDARNRKRKFVASCIYPNCNEKTSGRYDLCTRHYKAQWQRVRNGIAENILDFESIQNKDLLGGD